MSLLVDTKSVLLQVLTDGEGYGLELIGRARERTNGQIRLLEGRVYPALRELEREGFLRSREGEPLPERGGRPRRYYQLTAKGQRAVDAQAETLRGLLTPRVAYDYAS